MGAEGVGSGVIIALAAVLWLAYLVPTWLQRREYLATERNALRLQQTLRIMAETSEVPLEVRAETTARSAAQQERVLKKQLQRTAAIAEAQDAAVARAAARRLAETQPAIAADVAASSPASRRLRRSRAITSAVLFAALVSSGFGVVQLLASGSWMLLAGRQHRDARADGIRRPHPGRTRPQPALPARRRRRSPASGGRAPGSRADDLDAGARAEATVYVSSRAGEVTRRVARGRRRAAPGRSGCRAPPP
jgi:hypothetical protein